jgi:biopolymer transport protein ExbB
MLASVIVFLERLLHLRRARIPYGDFLKGVFNILKKGNIQEAVALCEEAPGPIAHLMHTAVLHRSASRGELREALESAGFGEISRLERRLVMIATIVQVAPLLGLLGSFLGMIETLLALRGQMPLVHSVDLTDGLLRALIAAAAGLMVAVPGYGMFNLLVIRIDRIVLDMEQATSEIVAFMVSWAASAARPGAATEDESHGQDA